MSSNPELACPTVSLFQSDLVRRMTCLTPGEVAIDAGCAHDIIRIGNTTIGHKDRQRLLVDLVQVMIPGNDQIFSKQYNESSKVELQTSTRIVYVWAELENEYIGSAHVPGARFVVWFWVVGSVANRAIALAWSVIAFLESLGSESGEGTPCLLTICYRVMKHRAMGIMVFDEHLMQSFTSTRSRALSDHPCHDLFHGLPVTLWPTRKSWKATQNTYQQMLEKTKVLWEISGTVPFTDITNIEA